MKETQFRILYRQFLFRMVDIELLSADAKGDMSKLFGQFAALLVFIGVGLAWLGGLVGGAGLPPLAQMVAEWSTVHFTIATTMLVVGLFAILSWDSTFPDRRDVMVLAPLPIRSRTIFLAKVAAVGTALSVTVASLHIFAGFIWPLSLNHRHEAVIAPGIGYDAAMAPLDAAGLEPVLKHDLAPALGKAGGVTVGVWKHGARRVFAYGTARPDSIFQIASIGKTFTALALAQLVIEGKARLDEPVREFLPPDTVAQHEGLEITLLDLATHRSGLPSIPVNVHSTDPQNPLAGYNTADLYAFMKYWGAYKSPYATFSYSNLGFGLLGQALANRAGVSYADLLRGITEPLGMRDTVLNLSAEQKARLIQGYSQVHSPVGLMDLGALDGAGAIYSTAGDMVAYLAANLHPETVANAGTLSAAIAAAHQLRAAALPDLKIALAWMYDPKTGVYLHGGVALGHTSYAFFDPLGDDAAVVLLNEGAGYFSFADVIGEHVRERLAGKPAMSLRTEEEPAGGGGILGLLRLFAAWWITMLMAGAFIYCCVLGAQGLAAQLLPRRHFLRKLSPAVLISTVLILILCVVGMRVVFSLPTDMRANWIFRITPIPAGPGCMTARRRALYALSVVPVCLGAAALQFSIWPWQAAAKHLLVLVLLGSATAELCLRGRPKLPFACSYLPGKSNFNGTMLIWAFLAFILIGEGTKLERDSFDHAADYAVLAGVLAALAITARWSASRDQGELQFEEAEEPAVFALDLHRDGVTSIATPRDPVS
jgi:CubicO group peptidase (beta-lactamase class C family)